MNPDGPTEPFTRSSPTADSSHPIWDDMVTEHGDPRTKEAVR